VLIDLLPEKPHNKFQVPVVPLHAVKAFRRVGV